MLTIALNRRFIEWGEEEPLDFKLASAAGFRDGALGWEELLPKHRVVILAEAGSGKSTEMVERARLITASGKIAFYATVEEVGTDGLEGALSSGDRANLEAWRVSMQDAWFFVDSVDEAKRNGVAFDKVVRRLAEGIKSVEERAHIFLSSRATDWEYRRDLDSFRRGLPFFVRRATPEQELLRIVRQERHRLADSPDQEQPLVVTMAQLDRERVRLFAEAKATPNLEQFLAQIEAADLWHFARRPLDLDWLVQFWQSEGRLGSLSEMLERSVTERLKEKSKGRARTDKLNSTRAQQAVERIGAALVFGRRRTITIPDSEIVFSSDFPLDLADVLPDWSADERALLLTRAVFDPATLGRARFHNDNEGIVRSYLTARWLTRLRQANLSAASLFDLLFANSYGVKVVKPSLQETAAWLALWDRDVARELVERSPMLLLEKGDPASLSASVRRHALQKLMDQTEGEHNLPRLDNNKLRLFAQPDLGSVVRSLWRNCHERREAAHLLLRVVWLGALKDCAQLAIDAVFNPNEDAATRVLGGKALLVTGDEQTKSRYARLVVDERSTLPPRMVRDALVNLFPGFSGIADLLVILNTIDVSYDHGGLGFEREGPELVNKLNSLSDLTQLLSGLLAQLGSGIDEHAHYRPSNREEAYFPAIATAACRPLKACPPEDAPELAIDAVLRIGNRQSIGRKPEKAFVGARAELHRTSSRRRRAFWRAAERIGQAAGSRKQIEHPWQMEVFGYQLGLLVEDIEWLMSDGLKKREKECRLAVNSAPAIQIAAGSPKDLLEKITKTARTNRVASEAYDNWIQRRRTALEPSEAERELKKLEQQDAIKTEERDQSWIDFARDLLADPVRIVALKIPVSSGVNPDLVNLWRLLDGASKRSTYAINSVAPLEAMFSSEVANSVREGLIQHWRSAAPLLKSERYLNDRNTASEIDLMAIAGISLEATQKTWAERLSTGEAKLAVGYATLELNGFPRWLSDLAIAKPKETTAVLLGEILFELSAPGLNHHDTLERVCHSDERIATLLAPALLADLKQRPNISEAVLSRVLQLIVQGIEVGATPQLIELGIERFGRETDNRTAIQYLAAVFSLDPAMSTCMLADKVAALPADERTAFVDCFLALTFGDGMSSPVKLKAAELTTETMRQLVRVIFATHIQATTRRPTGVVYQTDEHDRAEYARIAVFNRFAQTPGAATFYALRDLQNDPNCPIEPAQLRRLAKDRAIKDSESAPWPPSEAFAFEGSCETEPRTPKDLQSVALRRLQDVHHDLLHGDFAQGVTLKGLCHEVNVQNWIAERLRLKQGRSYSVEREPHVVDEKEPDVRLRAKATDASVAIEIKVAEDWNLSQLEDALEDQLCRRYLRAEDGRYGILLLVHQKARRKGWKDANTGRFLTFEEVLAHLSAKAALVSSASIDAPQPEVCAIDVSSCG